MPLSCKIFAQSAGKLIGAGGAAPSAINARKTFDGVLNAHTADQSGNSLGIAVTAADILHAQDHAVLNLNFNCTRANALCVIGEFIQA